MIHSGIIKMYKLLESLRVYQNILQGLHPNANDCINRGPRPMFQPARLRVGPNCNCT